MQIIHVFILLLMLVTVLSLMNHKCYMLCPLWALIWKWILFYSMYRWRTGLWNAAPRLKIHANFPTPCQQKSQNHKDPPEVHDHDRNNHWKGYQSIQWRPWNQAVLRWTKNRSARRKNHRISQGDGQKPHPTIIDRAESRRPESQRWHCVSDQINQRLVSP